MIDGFGRTVDYLRLPVTGLCNYRCQYRMPAEGVRKHSHEEIFSVDDAFCQQPYERYQNDLRKDESFTLEECQQE